MAYLTKGARNQGSAWGALLKAHSAEKQRTEKNPSPLIPNEQPISTINKKSPGTSPQPNSSPVPDPSLQTNSDPSSVCRLGNLRVALEEEDEDWIRERESSPITFLSEVLMDIPSSDIHSQQQHSLESTQLALGVDSLDRDKPIMTGTVAASTASTFPEATQSIERDGKYADWGAWHLQQLGTLQTIKQNTDSSPNDRNSFASQLLTEKSDTQSTVAKPITVYQLEPTKSASNNQIEQELTFGFPLESTQPERSQKVKQKKKKEKKKEDSPSCTTPVELNLQVPSRLPEAVSQPSTEFRAFNLPRAYLSSESHDSNLSPPPSPNPSAVRSEQTSSAASKASTANAKSGKEKETAKPKPASASTTSYNIAPLVEKRSQKFERPPSSRSNTKAARASAAAAAAAVPEWQSSSPPVGTFANDPVPQFDRATFPALAELRPSGSLSGPYARAFLSHSLGLQPEPPESGLAALNALQEREMDSSVLSFEDWCLTALADLHISSDIEVAADELHALDSDERVYLRVCLLVGKTKSALADAFASSYVRKRERIDLQRLRLRAEQRKRTRAMAAGTRSRSALAPLAAPATSRPLRFDSDSVADPCPDTDGGRSAFLPHFNVYAASFMPHASGSSGGSLLAAAESDLFGDSAADAPAKAPKFKAKAGGKKTKGKPIDPTLLGFQ